MKNKPLISVIIPCYNSSPYLHRCLTSLLNQEYGNIEIIIVDDGSTDDSPEIIKIFEKNDKRVKLFFSNHLGAGHARNVGIDNAAGDYFCFADSDDYVSKTYVSNLINNIMRFDSDLSCSGIEIIKNNSKKTVQPSSDRIEHLKQAFTTILNQEECEVSLYGKLFPRRIFDNNRIPEGTTSEDLYFLFSYLPLCDKGVSFASCSDYYYMIRPDSVSSFNEKIKQSDYDAVKASFYGLRYLQRNYREISNSAYKILLSNIAKLVYKISYNGLLCIFKNFFAYNIYKFYVLTKIIYIKKSNLPVVFKKILIRYAFSALWFSLFLGKVAKRSKGKY